MASFSSYQYTRKAWKKEVFDLLLDPTFFQMDGVCLNHWRVIIDNLMTNDRTTFKDLLGTALTYFNQLSLYSLTSPLLMFRFCLSVLTLHNVMTGVNIRLTCVNVYLTCVMTDVYLTCVMTGVIISLTCVMTGANVYLTHVISRVNVSS